jgi:alpha-ketoglutarate-dependent taurine dioxygenase
VRYSHKWREGDVVIVDNLAVAHRAAPGAHTLDAGLRILHRTTVQSSQGMAVQVDPIKPMLKAPKAKHLKLNKQ